MSRHDGYYSIPGNPTNDHRDWIKRIEIENSIAAKFPMRRGQASGLVGGSAPPSPHHHSLSYSPPGTPTLQAPRSPAQRPSNLAVAAPTEPRPSSSQSVRSVGSASATSAVPHALLNRIDLLEQRLKEENELRYSVEVEILKLRGASR